MSDRQQPRQPVGSPIGGQYTEFKGTGASSGVKAGLSQPATSIMTLANGQRYEVNPEMPTAWAAANVELAQEMIAALTKSPLGDIVKGMEPRDFMLAFGLLTHRVTPDEYGLVAGEVEDALNPCSPYAQEVDGDATAMLARLDAIHNAPAFPGATLESRFIRNGSESAARYFNDDDVIAGFVRDAAEGMSPRFGLAAERFANDHDAIGVVDRAQYEMDPASYDSWRIGLRRAGYEMESFESAHVRPGDLVSLAPHNDPDVIGGEDKLFYVADVIDGRWVCVEFHACQDEATMDEFDAPDASLARRVRHIE